MPPISGQFHANSTKCTPKRLTGNDLVPLPVRCRDVEDQAHPAVAMVDDDNRIVAAEGPRETDGSGGGDRHRSTAHGLER